MTLAHRGIKNCELFKYINTVCYFATCTLQFLIKFNTKLFQRYAKSRIEYGGSFKLNLMFRHYLISNFLLLSYLES